MTSMLSVVGRARGRSTSDMEQRAFDLRRDALSRAKHIRSLIESHSDEEDRRALLEDHSFEAFHLVAELVCMCEPSSSNVGTQPNSQLSHSASMQHHQAIVTSNRPVAAELEGALFTLEMLLRYLPDLVARRWQFEAINSIVSKCLQPCNVSAMRKYSMRLFIAWYQAVGSAGRSTPYLDEQFVHLLPFDILDQDGSSEQNSNFQNLSLQARCSVFHAFVERFLESITKESSRLCWKGDKVDRRRRALNFLIFKLKERFLPRCFPDGLEETPFTLKQAQQFAFRKPLDPETSTVICRYCLIRWLTKHLRDYSDVGTLRSGTEPEAPPMGCELLKPVILDSPENLNWTFALFRESLLLPIKCAGLMNRVLKVLRQWHAKPPPNCTSDMLAQCATSFYFNVHLFILDNEPDKVQSAAGVQQRCAALLRQLAAPPGVMVDGRDSNGDYLDRSQGLDFVAYCDYLLAIVDHVIPEHVEGASSFARAVAPSMFQNLLVCWTYVTGVRQVPLPEKLWNKLQAVCQARQDWPALVDEWSIVMASATRAMAQHHYKIDLTDLPMERLSGRRAIRAAAKTTKQQHSSGAKEGLHRTDKVIAPSTLSPDPNSTIGDLTGASLSDFDFCSPLPNACSNFGTVPNANGDSGRGSGGSQVLSLSTAGRNDNRVGDGHQDVDRRSWSATSAGATFNKSSADSTSLDAAAPGRVSAAGKAHSLDTGPILAGGQPPAASPLLSDADCSSTSAKDGMDCVSGTSASVGSSSLGGAAGGHSADEADTSSLFESVRLANLGDVQSLDAIAPLALGTPTSGDRAGKIGSDPSQSDSASGGKQQWAYGPSGTLVHNVDVKGYNATFSGAASIISDGTDGKMAGPLTDEEDGIGMGHVNEGNECEADDLGASNCVPVDLAHGAQLDLVDPMSFGRVWLHVWRRLMMVARSTQTLCTTIDTLLTVRANQSVKPAATPPFTWLAALLLDGLGNRPAPERTMAIKCLCSLLLSRVDNRSPDATQVAALCKLLKVHMHSAPAGDDVLASLQPNLLFDYTHGVSNILLDDAVRCARATALACAQQQQQQQHGQRALRHAVALLAAVVASPAHRTYPSFVDALDTIIWAASGRLACNPPNSGDSIHAPAVVARNALMMYLCHGLESAQGEQAKMEQRVLHTLLNELSNESDLNASLHIAESLSPFAYTRTWAGGGRNLSILAQIYNDALKAVRCEPAAVEVCRRLILEVVELLLCKGRCRRPTSDERQIARDLIVGVAACALGEDGVAPDAFGSADVTPQSSDGALVDGGLLQRASVAAQSLLSMLLMCDGQNPPAGFTAACLGSTGFQESDQTPSAWVARLAPHHGAIWSWRHCERVGGADAKNSTLWTCRSVAGRRVWRLTQLNDTKWPPSRETSQPRSASPKLSLAALRAQNSHKPRPLSARPSASSSNSQSQFANSPLRALMCDLANSMVEVSSADPSSHTMLDSREAAGCLQICKAEVKLDKLEDVQEARRRIRVQRREGQSKSKQHAQSPTNLHPPSPTHQNSNSNTKSSVMCELVTSFGWHHLPPDNQGKWLAPLVVDDKFSRQLKHLDGMGVRELHKIAVIYVAEGQETKSAILANTSGSVEFEQFVSGLGWEVDLAQHAGYMGGLPQSGTSPYYSSATVEIMWHVSTRLARMQLSDSKVSALRHLGNDEVHVVWSSHWRDYSSNTIATDFADVLILICPLHVSAAGQKCYSVQVRVKQQSNSASVGQLGPLFDSCIVAASQLAPLVRHTALNASRMCRRRAAGPLGADWLWQRQDVLSRTIRESVKQKCLYANVAAGVRL